MAGLRRNHELYTPTPCRALAEQRCDDVVRQERVIPDRRSGIDAYVPSMHVTSLLFLAASNVDVFPTRCRLQQYSRAPVQPSADEITTRPPTTSTCLGHSVSRTTLKHACEHDASSAVHPWVRNSPSVSCSSVVIYGGYRPHLNIVHHVRHAKVVRCALARRVRRVWCGVRRGRVGGFPLQARAEEQLARARSHRHHRGDVFSS